jgi:hypothetical protein
MNYTGVVVSLGTKNGDSLSELCSHEEWTLATPNGLHWPKPPPGILLGEERTPRGSSREGPKLLLYLVYGEICRIDITADYKRGEIDALSDSGPVEIIAEMRSCSFFPSDVFWDSIILSPPYEMVAAE